MCYNIKIYKASCQIYMPDKFSTNPCNQWFNTSCYCTVWSHIHVGHHIKQSRARLKSDHLIKMGIVTMVLGRDYNYDYRNVTTMSPQLPLQSPQPR